MTGIPPHQFKTNLTDAGREVLEWQRKARALDKMTALPAQWREEADALDERGTSVVYRECADDLDAALEQD